MLAKLGGIDAAKAAGLIVVGAVLILTVARKGFPVHGIGD